MVRINFDQFIWLAEQEAKKLDTTTKLIYYSAHKQLSDAYSIAATHARETEELDEPDRSYYIDLLAEEYREQRAALAAMTLALLWRTVKFYLDSMVAWLENRFPPQFSPTGKSELDRTVDEYRSRFGVELEGLSHFATVREVVLARNSALHNGGQPIHDYMDRTERHCLDQGGHLNLTPELLETLVGELKQFITELGREMSRATQQSKTSELTGS
jgi:hypothetical protein